VLARLEMQIALETILAHGVVTADGEPAWSHWPEYGPVRLPVRIDPL
jgi:cytochrome P450